LKKTILAIDDSRPILALLHVLLNRQFEVSVASSAFDAMLWLNNGNTPDLIISDIQMPEIDGWEFIANLRTSLVYGNIPIIVLSGSDQQQVEDECEKYGITDYLPKPFDPKMLLNKITHVLEGKLAVQ